MTITGAPAAMEEPIETAEGHATEVQTERGRRIVEGRGAEIAPGTIVVGGMSPVTVGAVVMGLRIPLPAEATAHALSLPNRMASRAEPARCAMNPETWTLVPLLTPFRSRSQLSLHRPKRRRRRIRRLSDSANFKP